MSIQSNKSELLRRILCEITEEYVELNSDGLVFRKYIAPYDAKDGDVCLVIEYVYYPSTIIVKGRTEGYGKWSVNFEPVAAFLIDDLGNQLVDDFGIPLTE